MRRFSNIMVVVFFIASLSGCDLINSWLGLDEENTKPELTITEPEDSAYLSKYTSFKFSGTYANIDSITLKIGDKEYSTMDVLANGKWQVEVDLSQINAKKDIDVVAYGYVKDNPTTAKAESNHIKITVHNWRDPATSEDLYKYLVLEDPDYTSVPAEITDIVTDGTYAYVSGYYMVGTSNYQAFVYRIDPVLGLYDKKYLFNSEDNYGYYPPVSIALGNDVLYVSYSIVGVHGYIKALDTNLNTVNYSFDAGNEGLFPVFYDMCFKDGYVYLTGYNTSNVGINFKIQDTGTGFANYANNTFDPYSGGAKGYGICIANNNNLYVAARYYNNDVSRYGGVLQFDNSLPDTSTYPPYKVEHFGGAMYGIYYATDKNELYSTGVVDDVLGEQKTILDEITDPNNISSSTIDHPFSGTSDSSSVDEEAGKGIIYDANKNYTVVVGYQKAVNDISNARASICVRNSGFNEEKTIIFNEDGYGKSCLNRVVKIGDKYFAVGYAEDKDSNKRPLIMFVPDSYN